MQFTVAQITDDPGWNATAEIAAAAGYPSVRTMTVGQTVASMAPLLELGAAPVLPWSVASPGTIGCGAWNCTSAVCWFYGKALSDALQVPIGLVSSNWGGTVIPSWSTNETNSVCGFPPTPVARGAAAAAAAAASSSASAASAASAAAAPSASDAFASPVFVRARLRGDMPDPNAGYGVLYNAMILPFAQGPLALSNIIWFQGESDLIDNFNSFEASYGPLGTILPISTYACQQKALVAAWRAAFASPRAFFGFVVLEPWNYPPPGIPGPLVEFRLAQLAALALDNVGYASAVDVGDASSPWISIHPRAKRVLGQRLANAALAQQYGRPVAWRGPAFASSSWSQAGGVITVEVALKNVPTALRLLSTAMPGATPFCQAGGGAAGGGIVAPDPSLCAWFTAFDDAGRVFNMSGIALSADSKGLVLTTPGPQVNAIIATSFGWGTWPVNAVYSQEGLPLEPWWCNMQGACAFGNENVF